MEEIISEDIENGRMINGASIVKHTSDNVVLELWDNGKHVAIYEFTKSEYYDYLDEIPENVGTLRYMLEDLFGYEVKDENVR